MRPCSTFLGYSSCDLQQCIAQLVLATFISSFSGRPESLAAGVEATTISIMSVRRGDFAIDYK